MSVKFNLNFSEQTLAALETLGQVAAAILVALAAAWKFLKSRRAKADGKVAAGRAPASAARRAARVVIVEDHRVLRETLRHWLQASGFHVVGEAATIAEANELPVEQADAAVVDLKLHGVTAFDVIRRFREQGRDELKIIAMSGYDEHRTAAIKAGADEFFAKGDPAGDLVQLLNRLLGANGEAPTKETP